MSMKELLERVKAATGPDRELDAAIHAATNPPLRAGMVFGRVPSITVSIDAAVAFAVRVLPAGVDMVLKQQTGGKYFHAEYETEDGDLSAYNHPSLPLAIIAATLTALISQEAQP